MLRTLKNKRNLQIYTEGEWHSIFGHSGALSFTGPQPNVDPSCPPAPCKRGAAGIHNVMGRFGIGSAGNWLTYLEGGFSSGDADVLSLDEDSPKLTTRAFNTNIKVGLLMYQVALKALTWQALSPLGAQELGVPSVVP